MAMTQDSHGRTLLPRPRMMPWTTSPRGRRLLSLITGAQAHPAEPVVDGSTAPLMPANVHALPAPAPVPAPATTMPVEGIQHAGYEVSYTTDRIHRVRLYTEPGRMAIRVSDAAGTYPQAVLCPSVSAATTVFAHADGTVRVHASFGRPAFLVGSVRTALPVSTENPGQWLMAPGERLYVVSPDTFQALAPQLMALVNRRSRLLTGTDLASLLGGLATRAGIDPQQLAVAMVTRLG